MFLLLMMAMVMVMPIVMVMVMMMVIKVEFGQRPKGMSDSCNFNVHQANSFISPRRPVFRGLLVPREKE